MSALEYQYDLDAFREEHDRWALRVNKGKNELYEIIRHAKLDTVSPIVKARFVNYGVAREQLDRLRLQAAIKASCALKAPGATP